MAKLNGAILQVLNEPSAEFWRSAVRNMHGLGMDTVITFTDNFVYKTPQPKVSAENLQAVFAEANRLQMKFYKGCRFTLMD